MRKLSEQRPVSWGDWTANDLGIGFDKKDALGAALNTSSHAPGKECLVSRRGRLDQAHVPSALSLNESRRAARNC